MQWFLSGENQDLEYHIMAIQRFFDYIHSVKMLVADIFISCPDQQSAKFYDMKATLPFYNNLGGWTSLLLNSLKGGD